MQTINGATKGNDNNKDYSDPPLVVAKEVAAFCSYLEIPFRFKGKDAMVTRVVYTKLMLAVFAYGYLLVFLGFSFMSSSTGWCQ